jgi:hypothetical protein
MLKEEPIQRPTILTSSSSLCERYLSELSISNLRSGNQSQSLPSFSSLSAGNSDSFNLFESLVEGELRSVMWGLDIIHGLFWGLKLLEVSARSLTELVELSLYLQGSELNLSGRDRKRSWARGLYLLASSALGLILLLNILGPRALSNLLHLVSSLIISLWSLPLDALLRSSSCYTSLNRSSLNLVLSDNTASILISELSNLLWACIHLQQYCQ